MHYFYSAITVLVWRVQDLQNNYPLFFLNRDPASADNFSEQDIGVVYKVKFAWYTYFGVIIEYIEDQQEFDVLAHIGMKPSYES